MFRKNYYLIILTIALVLTGSLAIFAQTQELSGQVTLKKADGTTEPAAGVTVEVIRIDKKENYPAVTTDEAGNFKVTGIPNEGEFVVSVNGPKINPEVSQSVNAQTAKGITLAVTPGDGKKYTVDQIREAIAKAEADLTAEEKKAREEFEANKKKIEGSNAAIAKALDEGVKAFDAKNYDLAIAKFDEGYQASPDYIGSAPGMLNNKGIALVERAVLNYNKMVQSKDPAERTALKPKVNKDFEDGIEAYSLSWKVTQKAKPEEIAKIQKNYDANKALTLTGVQKAVNLMNRTESVSEAKKVEVLELMRVYLGSEKDPKKKASAQLDFASYLLKANDYDNAIIEYRKAVELEPNNADAVGGLGLSLWTATYGSEDTAKKQEALNYMQYFLDIAPKDHKLRDGIEGGVADLKSQKLTPKKIK
jgi:tetratricopeptide (TPR) repeat protein